ncbi:MAG TPA: tetratricopeptide repeat protein [Thermoanaerobaculia bacterium]|nr:tetratricopeptide repeat protein [Thermoanaerobaculia bacterium]
MIFLFVLLSAGCGGGKASAPKGPATLSLPPANPQAVGKMVQGVQAAKDGQRDRAASLLKEAIALDANLWEARYDLGAILGNEGDLAGSEDSLALAAKLAPDSQDVAVALADVRRRRGEQKEAADGLADFVQDHPNAVEARTLFVAALRESGQIDKAIAEAREVLVRKPADASALAELSLSHLAKGEKEAAALLAKQALDSSPNSAVAHRATGLLDLANGDDAEAFAEFRKAADADPHDTTSRLNMGVVLLHAGAYSKAEEQYREILKVSPGDTQAEVGLAAALRGATDAAHPQKLEEARALLEKVLASDPHETSALFNLGVLYADFLKRSADAAPYFRRFLADAPSDHPLRADAERYMSAAAAAATGPSAAAAAATGPSAAPASAPPAPSPAQAPASPPGRPSPPPPPAKK